MRTMKRNPLLSGVCAILGGAFLWANSATAEVVSDAAAAVVVFPKIVVDTEAGVDTVIQLSNTANNSVNVRCFYTNANAHCSNDPTTICYTNDDCLEAGPTGVCVDGWNETDFRFRLTARQPIVWRASTGLAVFPLRGSKGTPADCAVTPCLGPDGDSNEDSAIPAVAEDPFQGELRCIQFDDSMKLAESNDLAGETTIVTNNSILDARGYNAVGIQARAGRQHPADENELVLSEDSEAMYAGCPGVVMMDHFFDDAVEPITGDSVRTDLTLIPCSVDYEMQDAALFNTTVQFLVFNEFEQRFSTSTRIRCFREVTLSDIDTRRRPLNLTSAEERDPAYTGDERSIFNVNVQGTLTGQTWIRGVDDGADSHGNGIIAVAEEFHRSDSSDVTSVRSTAAINLQQRGIRSDSDIIRIPTETFPQ